MQARIIATLAWALCAVPLFAHGQQTIDDDPGATDLQFAQTLMDWARQYRNAGNTDMAEQVLRHALGIREETLGPEHPDALTTLIELASLLQGMGRESESGPLYERALASAPGNPAASCTRRIPRPPPPAAALTMTG